MLSREERNVSYENFTRGPSNGDYEFDNSDDDNDNTGDDDQEEDDGEAAG